MLNRLAQTQNYPLASALVLSLLVFSSLFYMFDGFYFQTESDTVFPTYIFGFYSAGENVLPNSFGCFSVLSDLFNLLYKKGVSPLIYDWFHVGSAFFCFTYWIRFFFRWKQASWLALPFIISLLDIVMPFEFSKTAIALSITGLHVVLINKALVRQSAGALVLVLGALVRPEPAVIATILFCASVALQTKRSNAFSALRIVVVPLVLLTGLSATVFNSNRTEKDVKYKQIRQYEYALADFRKGIFDTAPLDKVDSVKVHAAQEFFFADREEINPEFFQGVGVKPIDKTPNSLVSNFFGFGWVFQGSRKFIAGSHGLVFHFVFLIGLCAAYAIKRDINATLIIISLVLVVLMSLFLKTEVHFITGTMMCAVLLSTPNNTILPREYNPKSSFSGLANTSLMILIGITATLALSEKIAVLNTSICKSRYYEKFVAKLAHKNPSSLVLNISFWDKLHYKLFSPIQPTDSEQMTVVDGGVLYLSDNYQNMLVKRSGGRTFIEQYLWLVDQRKTFVSSEKRMRLLTDYINLVYNQELKFNRIIHVDADARPTNSGDIGFYQYLTENQIETF